MAVVLDTDTMPAEDRAAAVISAMIDASVPSHVILDNQDGIVQARMDVWSFGAASIFRADTTGMQLVRTAKQAKTCPSPNLAIAVQEIGDGLCEQGGEQRVVPAGHLMVTDLNSAYDFCWDGHGASQCLHVALDDLGMPHDVIRDASTRLHISPLYELMVNHITGLTRRADELSTDTAAANVGAVSVELARALLASAAHDTRYRRDALATTLLTQVRAYIRRHLADPHLTPETIAVAHNISVRHLYKVCANADFSLHQWMTSQRLQGARDELAGSASQYRSIAMVAQRWGFSNPTHFSRRFRDAYGISPREWRYIADETSWPDR
ncbi:MAG TPA: helix-turn-helix domain-containing protein [Mycobacterium sp.]|nr:helix-turn-helix domain-containing protein [Mycobacterium sp.]